MSDDWFNDKGGGGSAEVNVKSMKMGGVETDFTQVKKKSRFSD